MKKPKLNESSRIPNETEVIVESGPVEDLAEPEGRIIFTTFVDLYHKQKYITQLNG